MVDTYNNLNIPLFLKFKYVIKKIFFVIIPFSGIIYDMY